MRKSSQSLEYLEKASTALGTPLCNNCNSLSSDVADTKEQGRATIDMIIIIAIREKYRSIPRCDASMPLRAWRLIIISTFKEAGSLYHCSKVSEIDILILIRCSKMIALAYIHILRSCLVPWEINIWNLARWTLDRKYVSTAICGARMIGLL